MSRNFEDLLIPPLRGWIKPLFEARREAVEAHREATNAAAALAGLIFLVPSEMSYQETRQVGESLASSVLQHARSENGRYFFH